MCYQLLLVSPLTLSEVRSMLEPGMQADALGPDEQGPYRALLRGAQTAVVLRAGRCACGLLPSRFESAHSEEAHLRDRYRKLGTSRGGMISALERHRRGLVIDRPAPGALGRLVAEHARNAGASAWLLSFSADDALPAIPPGRQTVQVADARAGDGWLDEEAVIRAER